MNAMLVSLAAGMCTLLGAALAWQIGHPGEGLLHGLLGFAAGMMVIITFIDLLPESASGGRPALLTFLVALFLFAVAIRLLQPVPALSASQSSGSAQAYLRMGWTLVAAIALHDLPEGFAIGAATGENVRTGTAVALALAAHNVPEGITIAVPFLAAKGRNPLPLLLAGLDALLSPLGTAAAGWVSQSAVTGGVVLADAIAAGAMLAVCAVELLPEAFSQRRRAALLGCCCGAVLAAIFGLAL
ncbi:MAG: ZIP family metal transporter [Firmicutes bacterium]|nr:ZIP family metal transporter [Bacillota bacterium]